MRIKDVVMSKNIETFRKSSANFLFSSMYGLEGLKEGGGGGGGGLQNSE